MSEGWDAGIERLGRLIRESRNAVFFGGAGVSTESGIPDFRGAGGLSGELGAAGLEEALSVDALHRDPAGFVEFVKNKLTYPDAKPNDAHLALARWEAAGGLSAVVTQNIDGLHQAAGSRIVHELHGSLSRWRCLGCGRPRGAGDGSDACGCGAYFRPEVTLYGEPLDPEVFERARRAIGESDLLIVAGTSLRVYPAAGLVARYRGRMAIINKTPTDMDYWADARLRGSVARAFRELGM